MCFVYWGRCIDQRELLRAALLKSGLELVDIKATKLTLKIKEEINDIVEKAAQVRKENISKNLCNKLESNYTRISKQFKDVTSITIEQYTINCKIEIVKKSLLYTELSISEISYKLNYSSSAHLTTQFKKSTGLTPSFFRNLKKIKANPLYIA